VNRSVPETLHRVYEQELKSLLETVLAGIEVSDRAIAERLVRVLGATLRVHQKHLVNGDAQCGICRSTRDGWWRLWPRRTVCSVHAALSFFLRQPPGHVLAVLADESTGSIRSRE
jgi:hypothetical protein